MLELLGIQQRLLDNRQHNENLWLLRRRFVVNADQFVPEHFKHQCAVFVAQSQHRKTPDGQQQCSNCPAFFAAIAGEEGHLDWSVICLDALDACYIALPNAIAVEDDRFVGERRSALHLKVDGVECCIHNDLIPFPRSITSVEIYG